MALSLRDPKIRLARAAEAKQPLGIEYLARAAQIMPLRGQSCSTKTGTSGCLA